LYPVRDIKLLTYQVTSPNGLNSTVTVPGAQHRVIDIFIENGGYFLPGEASFLFYPSLPGKYPLFDAIDHETTSFDASGHISTMAISGKLTPYYSHAYYGSLTASIIRQNFQFDQKGRITGYDI